MKLQLRSAGCYILSKNIGEIIGKKWKQICTTDGFKKQDPNNPSKKISALHIERPQIRHMRFAQDSQDGTAPLQPNFWMGQN